MNMSYTKESEADNGDFVVAVLEADVPVEGQEPDFEFKKVLKEMLIILAIVVVTGITVSKLTEEQGEANTLPTPLCIASGCPHLGYVGDGFCDRECFNEACNFDGNDCEGIPDPVGCWEKGCTTTSIGNGDCWEECNITECGFSLGDCVQTACELAGCSRYWLGNRNCDEQCSIPECDFDILDCQNSSTFQPADASACQATGCNLFYLGDGICDRACYNEECEFDGLDCESVKPECFTETSCSALSFGDNICELSCNNEACGYDQGDCL